MCRLVVEVVVVVQVVVTVVVVAAAVVVVMVVVIVVAVVFKPATYSYSNCTETCKLQEAAKLCSQHMP